MQLRDAKEQEATLMSLTREHLEAQEVVAESNQSEAKAETHDTERCEGEMLADRVEQEQRNQAQQRAKLQSIIQAFRKGQT